MKTTLSLSLAFGLALSLVACGGDDGNNSAGPVDAPGQANPGPGSGAAKTFTLTTTAFTPNGTIPADNTCHGANTSPDLAWTNPPAGAKSFAVVLTDKTATLTHWALYDIPATATGVPAHVENTFQPASVAGAQQTISVMDGSQPNTTAVIGFFGPCPPAPTPTDNGLHTYVFTVYALDVATVPRLTATNKANEGLANIVIHSIGSASFTGDYTSPVK